ncbi:DUF6783 domain-containing protein [Fusicatenibacter saccharivorans]
MQSRCIKQDNKRNSSPTGWDSQLAKSLFQTHSEESKRIFAIRFATCS